MQFSRKEAQIAITRDGRDQGGVFVIREMSALAASDWFIRAVQLLARAGAEVPPGLFSFGPEAFAAMGVGTILAGVSRGSFGEIKPLLDELLGCVVSYHPPGALVPLTNWGSIHGQIQEVTTIYRLYEEVLSLHLGFSLAAKLLELRAMVTNLTAAIGQNTGTSTPEPEPSSLPATPPG